MTKQKNSKPSLMSTNTGFLSRAGNVGREVKGYAKIRSWGDKNSAWTGDGLRVERQEFIYVEGYGLVRCLPTSIHFVYEDKSGKVGRWAYMCTCGSLSGIVSYKEIRGLITPSMENLGEYVLACIHGLSNKQATGIFRHADNSTE